MNEQPRRPLGPQPWPVVRDKLDQSLPFANMRDTPLLPRLHLGAVLGGQNTRAATGRCAPRCASTSSTP